MRVLRLRNISLPLVTGIGTWHDKIALPAPFGRELFLVLDGYFIILGCKYKVLTWTIEIFDGLHIFIIICHAVE